ncbi:MAG: hypothetical protein V1809_05675 [Planctomycetota bacterium]
MAIAVPCLCVGGETGSGEDFKKYEFLMSLSDSFTVFETVDWQVKVGRELSLRFADVEIYPKKGHDFSMMLYFKCDTPDIAQFDTIEKIEKSVRASSEKYLPDMVEKSIELKNLDVNGWFGRYVVLTDKKYGETDKIPEEEFKYITRGMIRLSPDSALGFSIMTKTMGAKEYASLMEYVCHFVKPAPKADSHPPVLVKPLAKEQQDKLLQGRLDGGMENSFRQFSNMFLVMSRMKLAYGVGLMTSSPEIANTELHTVFPEFYKPTLREFLDMIALQTSSTWKYDPTSKYFESDVESKPVEDLAMFEFTKTKREKPFQVTLPKGWKANDKGNWMMFVPPIFPLGMDIHELGSYSSDDKIKEKELLKRVPIEVSLEWAKRTKDKVDPKELKSAKVGPYDALYFETMMPFLDESTVRWRQWVFMVDNKCYFLVSTIYPKYEERIFPDVQKMVESFQIKSRK